MSARSIKRDRERELAKDERRNVRRAKRASVAAGAALGATVMFAPSAQAADFEVNTLADTAVNGCDTTECTLREAITDANANSEDDTITFESALSGEIALLAPGQLSVTGNYGLSIIDDGSAEVSISGGDSYRIFYAGTDLSLTGLDLTDGSVDGSGGAIYLDDNNDLTIFGSTVTSSYASDDGGGIFSERGNSDITVTNTEISGNTAADGGGAIALEGKYGYGGASLDVSDSVISGNDADFGGGIFGEKYTDIDVSDSAISGNDASVGGGGIVSAGGSIDITNTEVSGNTVVDGSGGGISSKYSSLEISESEVSGNESEFGGGVRIGDSDSEIRKTTIAGNTGSFGGGGVAVGYLGEESAVLIAQSTISGNQAESDAGGGLAIDGEIYGEIEVNNSTISGNSAGFGGGVSIDRADTPSESELRSGQAEATAQRREVPAGSDGSLRFTNSTIADNQATEQGGGVYLGYYTEYDSETETETRYSSTVPLSSTIVADNTAGGAANDLAEAADTTGGSFQLNYSLVETPGTVPITQSPAGSSIVGTDPQLGNLADNGGPTLTHLPTPTSPVIDTGVDNETARDQRGQHRSVDLPAPNNPASDPTDIGSVELQGAGPEPETRPLTAEEIPGGCELTLETAGLALGGTDAGQTIIGSDEDDVLRGFGGADTVIGKGGDDCLTGDDANDTIRGKAGDDFGLGGDGVDFMKGNGGDDEFRGNGADDRIKLAAGNDTGAGGGGDDNVAAGNGEDKVKGNAGDDRLFGNDGDDNIKGGGGDDVIFGGGGVNKINCGSGDDKVVVNGAKDEIANNCETVKVRGADKNN